MSWVPLTPRSDDHYYHIQSERSRIHSEKETLEKVYQTLMEEHQALQSAHDDVVLEKEDALTRLKDARREVDDRRHDKSDAHLRNEIDRLRADLCVHLQLSSNFLTYSITGRRVKTISAQPKQSWRNEQTNSPN